MTDYAPAEGEAIEPHLHPATTYAYALGLLRGIGGAGVLRVLRAYPTEELLLAALDATMASSPGPEGLLSPRLARLLREQVTADGWHTALSRAQEAVEQHVEAGIGVLTIMSPLYPLLLSFVPDAPPLLYYRGNLQTVREPRAVAVVGSRNATHHSLQVSEKVAYHFATTGYTVVSGLAVGCDVAAHRGALRAGGATVAVLPTPLDRVYPAEHQDLAAQILESGLGALVGELPLGTPLTKSAFVRRDRIQAGLSLAVIPVQSAIDGGTMHTAQFALDYGRLLLCPRPPEDREARDHKENGGVQSLILSGKAEPFDRTDYPRISELLTEQERVLLGPDRA